MMYAVRLATFSQKISNVFLVSDKVYSRLKSPLNSISLGDGD